MTSYSHVFHPQYSIVVITFKHLKAYIRHTSNTSCCSLCLLVSNRWPNVDHNTDALACLHWLRIPERIDYKVAVLTYKVLHGSAPRYLGPLVPVADLPGRRTLRCGGTNRLMVPPVRRSTVGDRAFTVAGPRV